VLFTKTAMLLSANLLASPFPLENSDTVPISEICTPCVLQALATAQSPWFAAGSSRGALKKLQEILTACTHLRVTGERLHAKQTPSTVCGSSIRLQERLCAVVTVPANTCLPTACTPAPRSPTHLTACMLPPACSAGKIVSILEPSRKRDAIVGVLLPVETAMAASPPPGPNPGPVAAAAAAAVAAGTYQGCLMLFPLDPRLPKCIIGPDNLATLPKELK
jgi:hypothetical protein